MLLKKTGFPEEGELLLCTITSIQPNSVFVKLDEYVNSSGMIHISEISPGRIRNIRDFVKEGKKIVCVVLRIHTERGHIDLSLRRVNAGQKKKKIEYIKQEQKCEKIVELIAVKNKIPTEKLFSDVFNKVKEDYSDLVGIFNDIVNEDVKLIDYGIDEKISIDLEELIRQRIKPPEVRLEGDFTISCFKENGVEIIKKAFSTLDSNMVENYYEGGGKYHLSIKASNYKEGEEELNKITNGIINELEKDCTVAEFNRLNKKK